MISLSAKKILVGLIGITGALLVLHVVTRFVGLQNDWSWYTLTLLDKFNLDAEISIPTAFSFLLFFTASCLLYLIYNSKKSDKRYWLVLSIIFLACAVDEVAALHEQFGYPVQQLLNIESGLFYWGSTIPLGLLLLLAVGYFVRFWWRLPSRTRLLFGVSAVLFLAGAFGVEMLSSNFISTGGNYNSAPYIVLSAIEETLELLGLVIFIYSLLIYARVHAPKTIVHIK